MSTDLAALIARVAAMLQRVLGEQIAVAVELEPALPPLRVDPGQLELAFINLALNARDAMAAGGTLSFRASLDPAEGPRQRVHVVVEDTGQGMDAETRARAFEPHFSTKPPGVGSGLGLAAVSGVIARSDGQVWIDSAPGVGTRVHLLVPVESAAESAPHVAPEPAHAARSVLVVDDRLDVRGALTNVLSIAGLVVHAAGSAVEAMAVLAELGGAIDVVLSDVSMPERSGIELAADVHARWPRLPVVLMSGNASQHASPVVAGWIEKPFALDEVMAVLDRVTR